MFNYNEMSILSITLSSLQNQERADEKYPGLYIINRPGVAGAVL